MSVSGLNSRFLVIPGVAGQQLTRADVEMLSVTGHGYRTYF